MKRVFTWVVILVGLVTLLSTTILSGHNFCFENKCGDFYWGAHEHDGIWHMALAKTAFDTWPPRMPSFAGSMLTGYNWLMDYPLAVLDNLGIPVKESYFVIMPILWYLALVVSFKKFADNYDKSGWFYPIFLFFGFFGSSLSFLLTLWHRDSLVGGSSILSMQPPAMLTNIQFALTVPIFALAMNLLISKKQSKYHQWLMGIFIFVTMGLKFYGGVLLMILVATHSLMTKRYKRLLISSIAFLLSTWIFYQPSLAGSSIFSFKPLATVYPIIEEQALVYIPILANARYRFEAIHSPLSIVVGIVSLLIFIIFNFGTRLIGILKLKDLNIFEKSILVTMVAGIVANILLVQRGEWWNTVQFLYYSMLLMSIFASRAISKLIDSSPKIGGSVLGIIILLSIPNLIDTLKIFWSMPPGSYVSNEEIEILKTLEKQDDGVVLALPVSPNTIGLSTDLPQPLYLRYESAYVSGYSGKVTYANDLVQARLLGIDYKSRVESVSRGDCEVLTSVNYIYIAGDKSQLIPWKSCGKTLTLIDENNAASLLKVD